VDENNLVATSVYTYNADLGWLTGLVHTINNTNQDVITYGYTYESDGQISSIDSSEEGEYDYTYDEQGQLTDVTLDAGSGAEAVEHYEYDAGGNRTSTTAGSSSSAYATGQYNRLESVDDGTNVTVYGYDAEGNLVLRFTDVDEDGSLTTGDTEITEYAWDHRNRLTSVTDYAMFGDYQVTPSQEVEYAYDYLNRLIVRTVDGTSEYFVYDQDASTNWSLEESSQSEPNREPAWQPPLGKLPQYNG